MEIDHTAEIAAPSAAPPTIPWPGYVAQPGDAPRDCPLCPRLVGFRADAAARHPEWWNAPVPGFGDPNAWLGIVGLAPGMQGANRTGRPFTGDWAGLLLFATLEKYGFSTGTYAARNDDGLELDGAFISNAVRCVPPGNKPEPAEIKTCRPYLVERLKTLPNLKVIIALGAIAHQSTVKTLGGKLPKYPFGHNSLHRLPSGMILIDSYHCSRYNTNTGRLTTAMFEAVFESALEYK